MLETPKSPRYLSQIMYNLITVKIQRDVTMGNQQERSLSWLGGILDGEGTISVQVYTLPDGRVRLTPYSCIVNSDQGILAECRRILTDIGVKHRFCGHSGTHKNCEVIRMDGEQPMRSFLPVIRPFLRSLQKARAADVVLEYLASRKRNCIKRDALGRILRTGYTRAEIELICSIRNTTTAKSSEAICRAPNVISDEDMVRPNGKPLEAGGTRNDLPTPNLFGWEG